MGEFAAHGCDAAVPPSLTRWLVCRHNLLVMAVQVCLHRAVQVSNLHCPLSNQLRIAYVLFDFLIIGVRRPAAGGRPDRQLGGLSRSARHTALRSAGVYRGSAFGNHAHAAHAPDARSASHGAPSCLSEVANHVICSAKGGKRGGVEGCC